MKTLIKGILPKVGFSVNEVKEILKQLDHKDYRNASFVQGLKVKLENKVLTGNLQQDDEEQRFFVTDIQVTTKKAPAKPPKKAPAKPPKKAPAKPIKKAPAKPIKKAPAKPKAKKPTTKK